MAGNRVEELEARVRDLEATVDGLTDELVETKERLHAMEGGDDSYHDIIEGRPTRSETSDQATEEAAADGGEESPDDGEASADEVKSDEAEEEDNADSESGDDIIVA